MKKLFLSLAALMMTMSAPMMTSCSNDLEEVAPVEEVKENVVTLTIKMPEQAETRVGIDDNSLKLTGWEENDVVKVYHFAYPDLSEGVTFQCTDPSEGIFTGTLPAGKTLSDYNFAVYGRDVEYNPSISEYVVFPANEVHDNLKDCICLAGPLDNGSCTMTIYNNVIKVTNYEAPATGAWKQEHQEGFIKPYGKINDRSGFIPGHISKQSAFDEAKITIPSGISYIFMPEMKGKIGFFTEDGTAIIPEKTINTAVVGKLFNVTLGTRPPVYSIAAMKFYEAEAAVPSNFVSMSKEDAVAMAKEKQANEGRPGYILIYEHVDGDTYKYITSDNYPWEGTAEIKNIRSEDRPYSVLTDCENCGYFECYWFTVVE